MINKFDELVTDKVAELAFFDELNKYAAEAGVPKRDGSGKGVSANSGRGCDEPTGKNRRAKEEEPEKKIITLNIPRRDGSGMGVGANAGRGCDEPTGRNRRAQDKYKQEE